MVPPLGHDYVTVVTAPTCMVGGFSTLTCSRCSFSTNVDNTDPLGHDYVDVVTAPTCLEEGFTTSTCSRCSDVLVVDKVPALEHVPGPEATCTENQVCTVCDKELASVEEHIPGNPATCEDAQVCLVCGIELAPALDHAYVAVVTAPTCEADGFTTNTCSRCDDEYVSDDVPALGHDWSSWTQVRPATVDEEGLETRSCLNNCGIAAQTQPIPVLPPAADGTDEPGEPGEEEPDADSAKKIPAASFTDVATSSIAFDAISWAEFHGYVTGGNGLFNPTGNLSRAQFALVLYRYDEGATKGGAAHTFTDVPSASIANEAISWANANGIVTGQAGRFNPSGFISRAQMVLMLHRYNKIVDGKTDTDPKILDQFKDKDKIAGIALEAMAWGVTNNLITGGNGLLNPAGNVTRAQVVLILYRYDNEVRNG